MQLRDAAETLGVHYQTAYAWVRQGVLPARKTGRGYDVSEVDVSALAARRAAGTAPRPDIRVRDWTAQADRLRAAIMSGDETLARHIFNRLASGVPLTELCERVISPALCRIGEDWAAARRRSRPSTGPAPSASGSSRPARASRRAARGASRWQARRRGNGTGCRP